jgi:tRNA-2-methylthio-N6-dimethylallyladenosine synthase
MGRSSQNKVVVFPKTYGAFNKGDYVFVRIQDCTGATLIGEAIESASDQSTYLETNDLVNA